MSDALKGLPCGSVADFWGYLLEFLSTYEPPTPTPGAPPVFDREHIIASARGWIQWKIRVVRCLLFSPGIASLPVPSLLLLVLRMELLMQKNSFNV